MVIWAPAIWGISASSFDILARKFAPVAIASHRPPSLSGEGRVRFSPASASTSPFSSVLDHFLFRNENERRVQKAPSASSFVILISSFNRSGSPRSRRFLPNPPRRMESYSPPGASLARFSNRVNSLRNVRGTSPTGPLRCLAMISVALPSDSFFSSSVST